MSQFILGEHEQAIRQLADDMSTVKTDVGEIKTMLAEQRGAARVKLWVAGAAGSVAATAVTILSRLFLHA